MFAQNLLFCKTVYDVFLSNKCSYKKMNVPAEKTCVIYDKRYNENRRGLNKIRYSNDLVNRAKKGDSDAFTELISDKKADLYRLAYLYVKNKDDALDIVSEAVYKTYISINKLKHEEYFDTWLTRILINCCYDFIKKNNKLVLLPEREDGENPIDHIPDNSGSLVDEKVDLYDAMDKLADHLKTIIILKYFRGLTITEISQVLEYPVGTVKTYLNRALKNLRMELKEDVK